MCWGDVRDLRGVRDGRGLAMEAGGGEGASSSMLRVTPKFSTDPIASAFPSRSEVGGVAKSFSGRPCWRRDIIYLGELERLAEASDE